MYNAVMENLGRADIIIKSAAPADYRVENRFDKKVKSESSLSTCQKSRYSKSSGEG
jgi:phosphopantothenoylcysteine synthetase/decarboxylase